MRAVDQKVTVNCVDRAFLGCRYIFEEIGGEFQWQIADLDWLENMAVFFGKDTLLAAFSLDFRLILVCKLRNFFV
jgi:hypothetical protein